MGGTATGATARPIAAAWLMICELAIAICWVTAALIWARSGGPLSGSSDTWIGVNWAPVAAAWLARRALAVATCTLIASNASGAS